MGEALVRQAVVALVVATAASCVARRGAAGEGPFVPKGGRIALRASLPGRPRTPVNASGLIWSPDGKSILFLAARGVEPADADAPPAKAFDVWRLTISSGAMEKLLELPGKPGGAWPLSGGRVLLQSETACLIREPGGATRPITGIGRARVQISDDGSFFACQPRDRRPVEAGAGARRLPPLFTGPILIGRAAGGAPVEVSPPHERPEGGELLFHRRIDHWRPDDRLQISTCWRKGLTVTEYMMTRWRIRWARWLYDPKGGGFRRLPEFHDIPRLGAEPREPWRKEQLWEMPGRGYVRRVLVEGREMPHARRDVLELRRHGTRAGEARLIEILDDAGKALVSMELDGELTGGGDVWPRCISADRRFLLVATFGEYTYMAGAPRGTWMPRAVRHLLVDLAKRRAVKGFGLGNVEYPLRRGAVAIMGASRQVLLIDTDEVIYRPVEAPNPNHGIWSVSFDGAKRANLARSAGLADDWVCTDTAAFGSVWPGPPARGVDRLAMSTRPEAWLKCPGPRHLLVFFNSANPIWAFSSKDRADGPANLAWSPDGRQLAFTAGRFLCVWRPTAEATRSPIAPDPDDVF